MRKLIADRKKDEYTHHPAEITDFLPMRSDSAPKGMLDIIFTRWVNAHRSGILWGGTPRVPALSSKKASEELSRVTRLRQINFIDIWYRIYYLS
uniref:Uncharacterized protein n=1 Tax=Geobacter sp. (strain M21) TaxID=443144 RepID=C6E1L2_GEOSM